MKYVLSIANRIGVKVEGATTNDDGTQRPFAFTLICDRLTTDEIKDYLAGPANTANDFFAKHAHDWRGQDLVLGESGTPAAYSVEAIEVLFSIVGMAAACWRAYLQQVTATTKN